MKATLYLCASVSAIAVAMPAAAQTTTADPLATAQTTTATGNDTSADQAAAQATLDAGKDIVVTAASPGRSRFRSSISVSQLSQDAVRDFTPRSEAEVLRAIPGIQPQDTAGPGGNSNIGVRGIPVSTGGSEYVALQEDGLPVTLFGDMNFGNNDYWLRFDNNVERVEAVRGGSASTFASQAPGAVINYISKTGDKPGGEIGISEGLSIRETRIDGDYGGRLSDSLRYHVGGYFRTGSGGDHVDYDILRGYQIKGNITKDLAGDRGFIRISVKRLDEHAPTNTVQPSIAKIDGKNVSDFQPLPTFDARTGSTYSIYNRSFQYLTNDGQVRNANVEGIHPRVFSIGGQIHYKATDWLTIDNNFRYSDISGNFTTQFLNVAPTSSILGSTVNGGVVGSLRYAAGPKAGQTFTGPYVNNNPNINVFMRDMGSIANNLSLAAKQNGLGGTFTATAGWFHMSQNISQEWHVNPQISELNGRNEVPLDLFSTTGRQLSVAGQTGFNSNWGTCCARDVNLTYTDDAPFLNLAYSGHGLDLDGSVRFDRVSGVGTALGGVTGPTVTVTDALGSAALPSLVAGGPVERINYLKSYTSWSLGALYEVGANTSVFARASRGGRFNGDRRVLGGNFNADGSLNAQGQSTAINFLEQQEIGLKQRGGFSGGSYSFELTGFHSKLTEVNYDFTRINNPAPNNNPNLSNGYRAYGVEFTGNVSSGRFRLTADLTYTAAKITSSLSDPITAGNRPSGIPQFQYNIQPSYDAGLFAIGASVDGQTNVASDNFNTYFIAGSTFVNGFIKVRPVDRLELGVNVNNLFNTLGYRTGGLGFTITPTSGLFQNSAVYGRIVTASARFRF
ncbi:TonB-dependent receptor [Sphingomonas sp. PAMC 26605]|uniref:TonB-dependent receptor n=1 Tax=Sphingomonas sp. PAMC 26605 TaxID=1112214 RepID=UPI00026CD5DE|nr:TonB-dependent receptor [Sphingomonas sp. PAMC 26605]